MKAASPVGWRANCIGTATEPEPHPEQYSNEDTNKDSTTHEPPAISGDGRLVAFVSDGDYDPWMANADCSAEVFAYGTRFGGFENITSSAGSVFPAFVQPASPDHSGGQLTFAADCDYSGGNPDANLDIWLYDSADGPFRQVDGSTYHTCSLPADGRIAWRIPTKECVQSPGDGYCPPNVISVTCPCASTWPSQ